MNELAKNFLVKLLERPELIVEDRADDIMNAAGELEDDEPQWLVATFKDERFPLEHRRKLARWLIGPSSVEIRAALSLEKP